MQPEIRKYPPKATVWGTGATIGFGLAIFAVYFTVQSLVAIPFVVSKLVANPELDPFSLAEGLGSNGLMISAATISSAIAGVGFIVLIIKLRKGISVSDYLSLKPIAGKRIFLLAGIGLAMLLLSGIISTALGIQDETQFTTEAYKTSVSPALFGLAVVIFAPLFEEAFFRGFLFAGFLQSRLGAVGTIMLTALTWAALHIQYDLYGIATILVLGVVLGIVRLKMNTLWAPLILHSFWNCLAFVITALYVNNLIS